MPVANKVGCSWSGGKDSCYALMKAMEDGKTPAVLLNVMNEQGIISRSHGLPLSLLQQQADAMGVPLVAIAASWKDYEKLFVQALTSLRRQYEIEGVVFGDIDLDAHREWEQKVCEQAGLSAMLPLWKIPRKPLLLEMLASGIKTMIVSCNVTMGETFLGKILDESLIPALESLDIDVCGESGEFHTVVVDCPLFRKPLTLPAFTTIRQDDYWFLQYLY
jgi:diphthine-ammonia ligase